MIYKHYNLPFRELEQYGRYGWLVGWFMMFNATFNNISVISWQSVLLVEETGVPRKKH